MLITQLIESIKNHSKKMVSPEIRRKIKLLIYPLFRRELSSLSYLYGSDKNLGHSYTQHYQRHFGPLSRSRLNLLEIGIGGYDDPKGGGGSLRMWRTFFPKANIFGIDIFDKSFHNKRRIKTFQGSQVDSEFLHKCVKSIGRLDIIIDDGSHYNSHVIETFKILFPILEEGGIYVIEDTQTSYWTNIFGHEWGGSEDISAPHTMMNFFKSLVDGLNYVEYMNKDYSPSYFDKNITSMHFYHNLIFIYKGQNDEISNLLR